MAGKIGTQRGLYFANAKKSFDPSLVLLTFTQGEGKTPFSWSPIQYHNELFSLGDTSYKLVVHVVYNLELEYDPEELYYEVDNGKIVEKKGYKVEVQFDKSSLDNSKSWRDDFKSLKSSHPVKKFIDNLNDDETSVPRLRYKLTKSTPEEKLFGDGSQQLKRNSFRTCWNSPY